MIDDRIIIRIWRAKPQAPIAVFVDGDANPGRHVSYMHVGQHSECDYRSAILPHTRPATSTELCSGPARDLLHELANLGYRPRILKRMPRH
jgi:hypothetical protein